ncbi:MAG: hypothetical protein ACJ8AD_01495 [Gemmatimonadaceae bacterium]
MITPLPSRSAARLTLALLALAGACAGASPSQKPAPNPGGETPRSAVKGPTPMMPAAWPIRSREHVDLWLHSYALLTVDSNLVPFFRRGYRDRLVALRRQRGVTTLLDGSTRATLQARFDANPSLATGGQFLPLYFESWEQMRQVIDLFVRANGNPRATNDPTAQTYIAILAGAFQTAPDREWLRQFATAVDDESRKFYHDYWTGEARSHANAVAHADSLWQRQWRPSIQRFLNNTQQQNGELYLSLPLGGEGRTIHYGKQQNAIAVPVPDALDQSEVVLYVLAHEAAGTVASTAIEDNTTPADRRSGTTSRYDQSAAVRAGALLLERTLPGAVPGYMRYYLQQAGRVPPADPRAMFASTFAVPDAVRDAIARQLDVILGGI